MTTFPKPIATRAAASVKRAGVRNALQDQQIVTLRSQTAGLVPGDWSLVTLQAGWSNVPGAIPAQSRLLTSTTVQVIGNIQNGTTTDGTIVGQLQAGYFNTVHQHTFKVVVVTGAAAVNNAVTMGSLASRDVDLLTVTSPGQIPVHNQTFTLGSTTVTIPSGGLGSNDTGDGDTVFSSQNVTNGDLNNDQTTPINYNDPSITLDINGNLILANVNPAATQLSWHEASLPLFTS